MEGAQTRTSSYTRPRPTLAPCVAFWAKITMEPLVVLAFAIAAWLLLAPLWALIRTSQLRTEVAELRRQLVQAKARRELPGSEPGTAEEMPFGQAQAGAVSDQRRETSAPAPTAQTRMPGTPPPLPAAASEFAGRSADPVAGAASAAPDLALAFPQSFPNSRAGETPGTSGSGAPASGATSGGASAPPSIPPAAASPAQRAASAAAAALGKKPAMGSAQRASERAQQSAAQREGLERWIGVRGAALVGGLLLALAAVLLFKHAFERGWIQPPMRIGLGVAGGLAALLISQLLEKRQLKVVPGALAGAGLVAWYASTWASHRLYGYLSAAGAMPLFALITVIGGWLAVRRRSQSVAVIGMLGGYATPLLLAVESPSAANFFGYLLVLECGVLWVALRARFGVLPLLAVLFGALLEVYWVLRYAAAENFPIVLAALAAQALLFSLVASGPRAKRWAALDWSRSLALGLCAAGGLLFASQARWQDYGAGQGLLFAAVLGGALYVERRGLGALPMASLLAVLSAFAPALAWWSGQGQALQSSAAARPLALMWLFPLLVLLVTAWIDRRHAPAWQRASAPLAGALIACLGMIAAASKAGYPAASWLLGPLLVGFLVLTLTATPAVFWSGWIRVPPGPLLAGLLAGIAAIGFARVYGEAPASRPWPLYAWSAWALLALLVTWAGSGRERAARAAGAALALVAAASLSAHQQPQWTWLAPLSALAAALAAWLLRRSDQGLATWMALPGLAALQVLWAVQFARQGHEPLWALLGLALELAGVLWVLARTAPLLLNSPVAQPAGAQASATPPAVAAATTELPPDRSTLPLALLPLLLVSTLDFLWQAYPASQPELWRSLLNNHGPALPTALMGAIAALAFVVARKHGPRAPASARALWMLAALLLGLALGRFLGGPRASFAIAAALAGWSAFGPRPPVSPGQPSQAPALTLLLCLLGLGYAALDLLLQGYVAHDPLLFSREALAFGASALFAGLGAQRGLRATHAPAPDDARQTPHLSAQRFHQQLTAVAALLFGLATASVLALDCFAIAGERTSILHNTSSSAQTVLSIAWALYALGLLVLGQRTGLGGVRWASLTVLCLALAKLFLFDLSGLTGLYRVASLLGLGLSLFGVSWIYQRLVFKAAPRDAAPEALPSDGPPPAPTQVDPTSNP